MKNISSHGKHLWTVRAVQEDSGDTAKESSKPKTRLQILRTWTSQDGLNTLPISIQPLLQRDSHRIAMTYELDSVEITVRDIQFFADNNCSSSLLSLKSIRAAEASRHMVQTCRQPEDGHHTAGKNGLLPQASTNWPATGMCHLGSCVMLHPLP